MLFKGNSESLHIIIDKLQTNQEHRIQIDTLGTKKGSSWASEERNTSPSSSCTTPTSTNGSEILYTVGVTNGSAYKCRYCDKSFTKSSYLKKHEQVHDRKTKKPRVTQNQAHNEYLPFQCHYCDRFFKHKRSRDRHIKLHTGDKKYKCDQCESAFSRSDHLKIHMKTHDHMKPYQCNICNRGYNTAAALTSHLQNHKRNGENHSPAVQPENTYKCLRCLQLFRSPEELRHHVASDNTWCDGKGSRRKSKSSPPPPPLNSCFLCSKDFSSSEAMAAHMQSTHKSLYEAYHSREKMSTAVPAANSSFPLGATVANFYCELCTMHFPTAPSHQKHMIEAHSIQYLAAAAATRFPIPEALNGEAIQAPVTTPYCVVCSLHFPTAAVFIDHCIATHGSGAGYSLCPPSVEQTVPTDLTVGRRGSSKKGSSSERTERNSPKKRETISHEMSNGNENIINESVERDCPQCDGKFIEFESFKSHIKWHLEASGFNLASPNFVGNDIGVQYRCSICVVATFPNAEDLARHHMTHYVSTSVAHLCPQCRMPFATPKELYTHMTETHVQQLYSCSVCREVFESRSSIETHFADKHRNKVEVYRCLGCPNSPTIYYSEDEIVKHVNSQHIAALFSRPEMPHGVTIKEENTKDYSPRRKVNSSAARYEPDTIIKNELCNGNGSDVGDDICDRRNFASKKESQSHTKRKHNTKRASPNKISLYCAYCNESCKSQEELALHTKSHSSFAHQSFGKCDICDEMCPNAMALAEHKLTHYKTIFNNDQNLRLQSVNHALLDNRIPAAQFLNANYFHGADLQKQMIPFAHFPVAFVNDAVYEQTLNRFYEYSISNGNATGGDSEHRRSSPNAAVAVDTVMLKSASTSSESYEEAMDLGPARAAAAKTSSANYFDQSDDEQIDVVDMKMDEENEELDEKP